MAKANVNLFAAALEAKDYRSFLRLMMESRHAHRAITLSELAKKSGFSSKGYISDLLAGRKKLTAKALPKILTALNLPKRLENYFELLAQLEEKSLRSPGLDEKEIQLKLKRLRRSFTDKESSGQTALLPKANSEIYRHLAYKVYASLGSPEVGADFPQIVKRSGLSEAAARDALDALIAIKLAREEKGRFFCAIGTIEALGLDQQTRFQEVLASATSALIQKIQQIHKFPNDFYFYSSFALDPEKELLLKKKLQELLCNFVDEHQNEDGELVKSIVIGFF